MYSFPAYVLALLELACRQEPEPCLRPHPWAKVLSRGLRGRFVVESRRTSQEEAVTSCTGIDLLEALVVRCCFTLPSLVADAVFQLESAASPVASS